MGWREGSGVDRRFVDGMDLVDERAVRRIFRIKVRTKAPIDEDIDDIAIADKQLELAMQGSTSCARTPSKPTPELSQLTNSRSSRRN